MHDLNMTQLDKKLDSEPTENHKFLSERGVLVAYKQENPGARITKNPLAKEEVVIHEKKQTGLRGPKVKFVELAVYEEIYGAPAPEKVKTLMIDGTQTLGVDVIEEKD